MANINLPNEGDFPWDLNPAITAINSEVEATTNLVTTGRLSEDHISDEIAGVVNTVAIPSTQKGAVNGVASLDSSGDVPYSQLPTALSPEQLSSTIGAAVAPKANSADVYSKTAVDAGFVAAGATPLRGALTSSARSGRYSFDLGTTARRIAGFEPSRLYMIVRAPSDQGMQIALGFPDSTNNPGTGYELIAAGQEVLIQDTRPVWAYLATSAASVVVNKQMGK